MRSATRVPPSVGVVTGDIPAFPVAPLLAGCLVAIAFLVSPPARAADSVGSGRFSFSANVGPSFVQNVHLTSFDDYETGTIRFDPGGRFDFEVSYRVWETLTIGVESGFLINETELPGEAGWTADGGLYQVPFLATVTFHPATGTRFHPFLGAGLGGVSTTLTDYDFFSGESDDAVGLAWQATVGCRYELMPGMDLGLAYKYLGTTDRTFDRLEVRLDGTQTHSVLVSFSMRF